MPLMKAMQISKPGGDFELVQKEIPEPGKNEVRIKVQACGICHGDAVVKEGHYPGIKYPRVPGHEVIGIIDKLGSGIYGWKTGQRVGVGWYGGPCLKCEACLRGDLDNCRNSLTTGISFDGGYAEYMVAARQALTLIPEEFGSLEAAPLLCAGRTTYTALRNSGAKGGDVVAVQGIGGLGHLAVQFSRKLGFKTVALSRGAGKRDRLYSSAPMCISIRRKRMRSKSCKSWAERRSSWPPLPTVKLFPALSAGWDMMANCSSFPRRVNRSKYSPGSYSAGVNRSGDGWPAARIAPQMMPCISVN